MNFLTMLMISVLEILSLMYSHRISRERDLEAGENIGQELRQDM